MIIAGFYGDESNCQPLENDASDCRTLNICDLNAECKLNQISGRHTCICKNGYRGDGIVCTEESESCEKLNNCGQNAECVADESSSFNYYCSCNKGFVGDGYTCIAEINSDDCNTLNNCHRDAFCALDIDLQTYQCQCKTGFTGDGYRCINSSCMFSILFLLIIIICSIYFAFIYLKIKSLVHALVWMVVRPMLIVFSIPKWAPISVNVDRALLAMA